MIAIAGMSPRSFAAIGSARSFHSSGPTWQKQRLFARWRQWILDAAKSVFFFKKRTKGVGGPEATSETSNATPTVRRNELGIQLLSRNLHSQIFRNASIPAPPESYVRIAEDHLRMHGLEPSKHGADQSDVSFTLPPLHGHNIDQHFYSIGMAAAQPWLGFAQELAGAELPPRPETWNVAPGWTRYVHQADGRFSFESVEYPMFNGKPEQTLVFDVETLPEYTTYSVMACAVSPNAWYSWVSPWLLDQTENLQQLIPMGDPSVPRLIVGHNVSYDRLRIREEYSVDTTQTRFLDTMALHIAVNGFSDDQRIAWLGYRKYNAAAQEPFHDTEMEDGKQRAKRWEQVTSANSLVEVARLHCGIEMDKETREDFLECTPAQILDRIQHYLSYCAKDTAVTQAVLARTWRAFHHQCPSPVSFAAVLTIGSSFLTVNEQWEQYPEYAKCTSDKMYGQVTQRLADLAEQAREMMHSEEWKNDVWLSQLDWTPRQVTKTKGGNSDSKDAVVPNWYKELTKTKKDLPPGTVDISLGVRISPILLRLSWRDWPLYYSREHGWVFRVPHKAKFEATHKALQFALQEDNALNALSECSYSFYPVPRFDGSTAKLASPLSKSFMLTAPKGALTSAGDEAQTLFNLNAQGDYWKSVHDSAREQIVVWQDMNGNSGESSTQKNGRRLGIILPMMSTMSTVTRHASDRTWVPARNATGDWIGSELQTTVYAPPGYSIVGASIPSLNLWISSMLGDAQFGVHGATALGWMLLQGNEAESTDLHTRTADLLGISRDAAEEFNCSRINGVELRKEPQGLSKASATRSLIGELGKVTNASQFGTFTHNDRLSRQTYRCGGLESFIHNKLKNISMSRKPQTVALECSITHALRNMFSSNDDKYEIIRMEWIVQSSGVDYLHLLIVAMDRLIKDYGIRARYMISSHDEVRYLVKDQDRYRAALALQIANLWTQGLFAFRLGMDDLPRGTAFLSAIDIDKVLRRAVDETSTPPKPQPGHETMKESLDIAQVLAKTNGGSLWPDGAFMHAASQFEAGINLTDYKAPEILKHRAESEAWLRAQVSSKAGLGAAAQRTNATSTSISSNSRISDRMNGPNKPKTSTSRKRDQHDWDKVIEQAFTARRKV
ncbi:DNA/RNA polymerase [Wolfiporia cocos MD-104 SS10]|uniref:Mitochondrial DNA polymerase catalytic subunit n=1 Tax=Wolfiporia cocos (strain MD-104) TaxID=742152 RepID=A0A2H3IYC0_WOLCO|nr:DNA/RNA polymerase [Wolfiporia cocos MD-104 SS10]